MSWLNLYAPAPPVDGIWDQSAFTAQAVQGPQDRTLTRLRADVAAALLLNQPMAQNHIHSPYGPKDPDIGSSAAAGTSSEPCSTGPVDAATSTVSPRLEGSKFSRMTAGMAELARTRNDPKSLYQGTDPQPAHDGAIADKDQGWYRLSAGEVPLFDDPNHQKPGFKDPDIRNHPDWHPAASPLHLTQAPLSKGTTGSEANGTGPAWPPLTQVTPVLLVPVFSILGATNEPA